MNNINPFGNSLSPSEPVEVTAPVGDQGFSSMGDLESIYQSQFPSQGIGSLNKLLAPIINSVRSQNENEFSQKIDPYIQQVQDLTQKTFPNINLSDLGSGTNFGGVVSLGVPVGDPLHSLNEDRYGRPLNTTPSLERSGTIDSPYARSILSNGLGSLFK
jgi:hypothetical protein